MKTQRNIKRIQEPRNGIQFVVSQETRQELKPIVFFDAGNFTRDDNGFQIGFHPHSGIGIITYFHGTDLHHQDSGGYDGIIKDGGAQWIRAGEGIWHQEAYRPKHNHTSGQWSASLHQLWVQLPPEVEEAPVDYNNIEKEEIETVDNVKILAGEYKSIKGKFYPEMELTYLDVTLKKGETWEFDTPENQTTGFVFPRTGTIKIGTTLLSADQMGILEHNNGTITVTAQSETAFVLVIAKPSPYPIVTNGSQIHTNIEALERSAKKIKEIGKGIK